MSEQQNPSIAECVRAGVQNYFDDLAGDEPTDLYNMVLQVVEKPLLEVVMLKARNNQSKAAQWLGMNRNTLRKKLVDHGLTHKMD